MKKPNATGYASNVGPSELAGGVQKSTHDSGASFALHVVNTVSTSFTLPPVGAEAIAEPCRTSESPDPDCAPLPLNVTAVVVKFVEQGLGSESAVWSTWDK